MFGRRHGKCQGCKVACVYPHSPYSSFCCCIDGSGFASSYWSHFYNAVTRYNKSITNMLSGTELLAPPKQEYFSKPLHILIFRPIRLFALISLRSRTNQIGPKNHNVEILGDTRSLLSIQGYPLLFFSGRDRLLLLLPQVVSHGAQSGLGIRYSSYRILWLPRDTAKK